MKPSWTVRNLMRRAVWATWGIGCAAFTADFSQINVRPIPGPAGVEMRLTGKVTGQTPVEFRLQRSSDLRRWENVGSKVRLAPGQTADAVPMSTESSAAGFFRLSAQPSSFSTSDGAAALGFAGPFADELDALGRLTPEDFSSRYQPPAYLEQLSWNPASATFWADFNNPDRGWKSSSSGGINLGGLALTEPELAVMRRQGFVVPERLASHSFADAYYQIFERDLPVFVTSDSILHAWHRSFDAILEEMETYWAGPILQLTLDAMAEQVITSQANGSAAQKSALEDADYFVAVAQSLLSGNTVPTRLPTGNRVFATLGAIQAAQPVPFAFFDRSDMVDFGGFTPRGHYTKTVQLQRYFRAMSWLGRVDLRVAGDSTAVSLRQLNAALILTDLLNRSGRVESFAWVENLIRNLIGRADSMNPGQLTDLARAAGLTNLAAINGPQPLERMRALIEAGDIGVQNIQGHSYAFSGDRGQLKLPRSFALLGQRFTPDSWTMNQVVWDRIKQPGSGELLRRRRSYSLDVAFAALGNNHVTPDLIANLLNPAGQRFRDGFPYQHNLAAARNVMDQMPAALWEDSIYNRWLFTLRALSDPTTGPEYPEAMRTHAWAMKTLNTQLASWTQLRHDTILYVKAVYVGDILCEYPKGFVEPRPEFFRRLGVMAESMGGLLQGSPPRQQFMARFASTCRTLEGMARKELARQPFSTNETWFVENLVERTDSYFGPRTYSGWYPQLFYRSAEGAQFQPPLPPGASFLDNQDSDKPDLIVADVLTAGRSEPDGDPGGVLHQGIGRVNLMQIAIDNGPDRAIYAGPLLSHYEFEMPAGTHLTDEQWAAMPRPPAPPWTRGYLLPRP